MPAFAPFRALRYSSDLDLSQLVAPPYDVLSDTDVDVLQARSPHNIVHIDVPTRRHGPAGDADSPYKAAGRQLAEWVGSGVLVRDRRPTLTIYRTRFTDATGRDRDIVGVLGALQVVDSADDGVLPHERVTPKASTDRLDLTRATRANLSPVWGLSLSGGLTELLTEPAEPVGWVRVGEVEHAVERIADPHRIASITAAVSASPVLIADGHHRYGVARRYRNEVRTATGSRSSSAEQTLCLVNELVDDQLSIEAIHRVYRGVSTARLLRRLEKWFELTPAPPVDAATLARMVVDGQLVFVAPDGRATWLRPRPGAFDAVRDIDGALLEAAVKGLGATVGYQHDLARAVDAAATSAGVVLIRPVGLPEIERTAREHVLLPPKSTFFTPKPLTGMVVRDLSDRCAG